MDPIHRGQPRQATDDANLLSVFPFTSRQELLGSQKGLSADCYTWWATHHLKICVPHYAHLLPAAGNQQPHERVGHVWSLVALELNAGITTLNAIVDKLAQHGALKADAADASRTDAVQLVHALLGLQTMLFTTPATTDRASRDQLSIHDELHGFEGLAIMSPFQDKSGARRPIHQYLYHFGMMLPPRHFILHDTLHDPEKEHTTIKISDEVRPAFFNAKLLSSIGHVTFKWTDSIACHLEFDENRRVVYLFRYPTFCFYCRMPGAVEPATDAHASIHGCARANKDPSSWATSRDVSQLLSEILTSYRLLFGQTKASRHFFRDLEPWAGTPLQGQDALLAMLCSARNAHSALHCKDKAIYSLRQDFPMLYGKMTQLVVFSEKCRPRSMKELWMDRRDNSAWLTLWAVLVIGGLGLLLAFLQVVMQAVQLFLPKS